MGSERELEIKGQDVTSGIRKTWPRVAIIVLNWNGYEDSKECLESLTRITYPNYEVFVVDNGSTDGSGRRLMAKYPGCKYIFTGRNLGYTGGNNVGIRTALITGAKYILLLGNDILVDPHFLEPMVNLMELEDKAGVVGPITYSLPGEKLMTTPARLPNSKGRKLVKYRKLNSKELVQEKIETHVVAGSTMLIRSCIFTKVGFFDNNYFLYWDEVDFCTRVHKAGLRQYICPKSIVHHKIEHSSKSRYRKRVNTYYHVRNELLYYSKHYHVGPAVMFDVLTWSCKCIISAAVNGQNVFDRLVPQVYAFIDFARGRFGASRGEKWLEKSVDC